MMALTAGTAAAQSDGRIDARLTTDWDAPATEDFAHFMIVAKPADKEDKNDKALAKAKTMAAVEDLLRSTKLKKPVRARLRERLARMRAEDADKIRAGELAAYEKAYDKWLIATAGLDPEQKSTTVPAPKPDHARSKVALFKAIETYRELVQDFPEFNARPDIGFDMALLLARADSPNAKPAYEKVIKDHPNSIYAARARVGLGDIIARSGGNGAAQAVVELGKAVKSKDALAREYANYRLAWVRLEMANKPQKEKGGQKDLAGIIRAQKQLAELMRAPKRKGVPADARKLLADEARKDLIYVYAESDREGEAGRFFGKDKEAHLLTLERIAALRFAAKRPVEAAQALDNALVKAPGRARNHLLLSQLATAWHLANDAEQLVNTLEKLRTTVADGTAWAKANADDPEALKLGRALARERSLAFARMYDKGPSKLAEGARLSVAIRLYDLSLKATPNADDGGDAVSSVRASYADVLRRANRKFEAAKQYHLVAKDEKANAKLRLEAAETMLPLAQEVAAPKMAQPTIDSFRLAKPAALSAEEALYTDIVDTYVKVLPQKPNLPALKLAVGTIALRYGRYDDATKRLDRLANEAPKSAEAATGVKLILTLHAARADWPQLITWSRNFLARPNLGDAALRTHITGELRRGMWEHATALAAAKKSVPAAEAYLAFQKEFPRDPEADKALNFAATLYFGVGQGMEGLKAGVLLVQAYPKSPLRPDLQLAMADVYEKSLAYEGAAATLADFSATFPGRPEASNALIRSAHMYVDAENTDLASRQLGELVRRYANTELATNALLELAELKEKIEEYDGAISAYERYAAAIAPKNPDEAIYAQTKAAFMTMRNRDANGGRKRLKDIETRLVALPAGQGMKARRLVAAQRFVEARKQAEPLADFEEVHYEDMELFTGTSKKLIDQVAKARVGYENVVALKDPEGSAAAHYELGTIYEKALAAFRPPTNNEGFSPQQIAQVQQTREKFLLEAREKMQKHWEEANRLTATDIGDEPWQRAVRRKLARLSPSRFAESPERYLTPSFTAQKLPGKYAQTKGD